MRRSRGVEQWLQATRDHGMLLVLLLLCAYFSVATLANQQPSGAAAAEQLAGDIATQGPAPRVLVVTRDTAEDVAFAADLRASLERRNIPVVGTVSGQPSDLRRTLKSLAARGIGVDVVACHATTASWGLLEQPEKTSDVLRGAVVLCPRSYRWPNFLKGENLLNVANQIAVIALVAVGMTLVIISGGIDLSVGSLIALSAVITTLLIRDWAGGVMATTWGILLCSVGAIAVCAAVGALSGLLVTWCAVPPFIATLGMMLVASGLAYLLARGESIHDVPNSFVWLGRGADLGGLPNGVTLMLLAYAVAHLVMRHTLLGRYLYAVGGNAEAARLAGVPVRAVLILTYTLSGAAAGLGGVVMASQLKSGAPTYGQMYELYIIAAVVVGGTSLAGGEGRVLGTLIGALIIAVIQNGMNLTGVESYTQKVVLGLVILGAVLADTLKRRLSG